MRVDVYLPLVLALLLAAVTPHVGRRISPALAARALTTAAVLTSAASTWALVLLGATLIDEDPSVASEAREGGRHLPEPVPDAIAIASLVLLGVIVYRVCRALRSHQASRRALRGLCDGHPPDSELIVAASPIPRAFAIPGSPGRILVTASMLSALGPAERRVLLAHERAHLTHRHSVLSTAVGLAAAANPLLVPVRSTVTFLLERWADEDAAGVVGDRRVTAHALARAALVSQRTRSRCALHFSEHAVARRIAALQTLPPPRLWPIAVAVLGLGAVPALGAVDATSDLLHLLAGPLLG